MDEALKKDEYEEGFIDYNKKQPHAGLPEDLFVVGNKIYGVCDACGSLVQVNKPILGSLHFCGEVW